MSLVWRRESASDHRGNPRFVPDIPPPCRCGMVSIFRPAVSRATPMIRMPSFWACRRLGASDPCHHPTSYALRACSRALLASSKPPLASCSQVAASRHRWLLTAVRASRGHARNAWAKCSMPRRCRTRPLPYQGLPTRAVTCMIAGPPLVHVSVTDRGAPRETVSSGTQQDRPAHGQVTLTVRHKRGGSLSATRPMFRGSTTPPPENSCTARICSSELVMAPRKLASVL